MMNLWLGVLQWMSSVFGTEKATSMSLPFFRHGLEETSGGGGCCFCMSGKPQ